MTDIKKGDRAKVTVEGEVIYTGTRSVEVRTDGGNVVEVYTPSSTIGTVSAIEKIEPPVEVFKTGDLVWSREYDNYYLITSDGYLEMNRDIRGAHNKRAPGFFTSKHYERVSFDSLP